MGGNEMIISIVVAYWSFVESQMVGGWDGFDAVCLCWGDD